uniref:Uncharacterized protein n=1 Tax=Rhizophagus irregularis (strain DAOM 181602 / DAOM 197198 / MUCL 43194) TaxID=747089 RepID=U9TKF9_RHIID
MAYEKYSVINPNWGVTNNSERIFCPLNFWKTAQASNKKISYIKTIMIVKPISDLLNSTLVITNPRFQTSTLL